MSRSLARIIPQILRSDLMETSPFGRWISPSYGRSGPLDYVDREFNRLENMIARMQNEAWRNLEAFPQPAKQEFFKIVEEEGKQKMRFQFQADNCKPEDIEVKTKGNQLEIRARQEETGKNFSSYHEYSQLFTLPEGVKAEELVCKFDDGLVTLEAPYTKPALPEGGTKELPIEHQQAEPIRKEIPIKREN